MAFEIQEIAIQMHIVEGAGQPGPPAGAAAAAIDREALIRECVRRVLKTLKEPGER